MASSVSYALWPPQLSGPVFLLHGAATCQGQTHPHACTHKQTTRDTHVSDDGNLFCHLVLRHMSAEQSIVQTLGKTAVSTGKCLQVYFFCFVSDANVSAA